MIRRSEKEMNNNINHNALIHLVEAGAVSAAIAAADGDIWTLTISTGEFKKTVMAKNSGKPRVWRKLDTLAKYLQKIGLSKFEIDITNYDAEQKSLRRPDSAANLKLTHQSHKSRATTRLLKAETSENPSSASKIKEKWEERRARILAEENPRV